MRISDQQKLVLGCIEHRANHSLPEISKLLNVREHAIRYQIERLSELRIIKGLSAFINLYALGFVDSALYFSLAPSGVGERRQLLDELKKSPLVSWISEFVGEYRYGFEIRSRQVGDAARALEDLSRTCGNLFVDKSLSIRVGLQSYGRKYLAPHQAGPVFSFSGQSKSGALDSRDFEILRALSNGTYRSLREIGRTLGYSISALAERVRRLERERLIQGYLYRIDPSKLGVQQYRFLIYSRGINAALTQSLERLCRKHPHITHFITCIGSWDYEVLVEAPSAEEVMEVYHSLLERYNREIYDAKVISTLSHHKFSSCPGGIGA